jgi:hypothetical protein
MIAAGLRAFPRPGLRELDLWVWTISADLTEALQSGACRGLERLSLKAGDFDGGVIMTEFVDAFGACPHLRELAVEIYEEGGGGDSLHRALAEVVCEGGLPGLVQLSLINEDVDDESATALAEALEARAARGRPVRFEDYEARNRAEEEKLAEIEAEMGPPS